MIYPLAINLKSNCAFTNNVSEYVLEIESSIETTKHCLLTAQLVDGKGYTAMIKDITEQKKREEIKKSQDLAEQSAKIKERFLASVSHEMHTPMNAILGIINLDIQMPKMNGYEATQYIRQQMPFSIKNIPILAMTAHAHISQNEEYKRYGMNDFVLKPFNPQLLFKKINQYLPVP